MDLDIYETLKPLFDWGDDLTELFDLLYSLSGNRESYENLNDFQKDLSNFFTGLTSVQVVFRNIFIVGELRGLKDIPLDILGGEFKEEIENFLNFDFINFKDELISLEDFSDKIDIFENELITMREELIEKLSTSLEISSNDCGEYLDNSENIAQFLEFVKLSGNIDFNSLRNVKDDIVLNFGRTLLNKFFHFLDNDFININVKCSTVLGFKTNNLTVAKNSIKGIFKINERDGSVSEHIEDLSINWDDNKLLYSSYSRKGADRFGLVSKIYLGYNSTGKLEKVDEDCTEQDCEQYCTNYNYVFSGEITKTEKNMDDMGGYYKLNKFLVNLKFDREKIEFPFNYNMRFMNLESDNIYWYEDFLNKDIEETKNKYNSSKDKFYLDVLIPKVSCGVKSVPHTNSDGETYQIYRYSEGYNFTNIFSLGLSYSYSGTFRNLGICNIYGYNKICGCANTVINEDGDLAIDETFSKTWVVKGSYSDDYEISNDLYNSIEKIYSYDVEGLQEFMETYYDYPDIVSRLEKFKIKIKPSLKKEDYSILLEYKYDSLDIGLWSFEDKENYVFFDFDQKFVYNEYISLDNLDKCNKVSLKDIESFIASETFIKIFNFLLNLELSRHFMDIDDIITLDDSQKKIIYYDIFYKNFNKSYDEVCEIINKNFYSFWLIKDSLNLLDELGEEKAEEREEYFREYWSDIFSDGKKEIQDFIKEMF